MKTRNHTKELSFNVSVTFEADDQFLECTPIRPIITAEGMIDDQALSDYYGFILELLFELDDARLVVIDEHESSSSETSKHYTLADKKHLNHDSTEYVINLRVSNQVLQLTEKQKRLIGKKRIDESSKVVVKWKVRNIVVNDKMFTSYDDAVEYVGHKAEEYNRSLNNHQEENK